MNTPSPAGSRNPLIKLIAVGGAGQTLAQHLAARGLADLPCALVNTAPSPSAAAADVFPLAARRLRELDVADAAECASVLREHEPALRAWCAGADVVLVVAGLGGKTGSGLAPVVAGLARSAGALVLGFVTLPFDCEVGRRQQAHQGWERLRAAADGVVCLPNQQICRLIDEHTSLLDTFKISNDLFADGMRGVWRLLSCNGPISVSFEELTALLRDRHAECLFATAEAGGDDRVRGVVEKLLAHPLLDEGRALAGASSVLVSVVAGTNLAMSEVNRVVESLRRHCGGAQVLAGAAMDAALGGTLSVTAIVAGRRAGVAEEASVPAVDALERDGRRLPAGATLAGNSRFAPLPTPKSAEPAEMPATNPAVARRGRKGAPKLRQEQLALEIHSRGRFEKSEPTILNGEDLDEPTYIRRGVLLN